MHNERNYKITIYCEMLKSPLGFCTGVDCDLTQLSDKLCENVDFCEKWLAPKFKETSCWHLMKSLNIVINVFSSLEKLSWC